MNMTFGGHARSAFAVLFAPGARIAAALVVLIAAGAGTWIKPAAAQFDFLMTPAQEAKIGAEQHPIIVKEFGGVYNDPEITAYLNQIANRMARQAGMRPKDLTFTVLNSPVVNAMALPGGYVYVTRGLVALANSEAEIAGVIGHEIGHVVERHAADRFGKATVAGIGGLLAEIFTGSSMVGDLIGAGSTLYLLNNSRQDEYEADLRGTEYLLSAGYDPYGMSAFLGSLEMQTALHSKVQGQAYDPNRVAYLSTHPNTLKRQQRAREAALATGVAAGSVPNLAQSYLQQIDGLLYGDDPREGYVRGRTFSHPDLRFSFTVPPQFRLINSTAHVDAVGPGNAQIRFDMVDPGRRVNLDAYMREWGQQYQVREIRGGQVRGMTAVTGTGQGNMNGTRVTVDLVAIAFQGNDIARFIMVAPRNSGTQLEKAFSDTVNSFRPLRANEVKKLKPLRVRVIQVKRGDTVESLAQRMAYDDFKVDRFLALNRLQAGATLQPGSAVKIVTE